MKKYGEGKQVYIRKLTEGDYPIYREITYSHLAMCCSAEF